MQSLDEKLQLGSLIKIKDKFKKAFMRKLKMSKEVAMAPFKILGRPQFGIVKVKSEENHKIYELSEEDLRPAYWLNYKNDLKAAWQENSMKGKRTTVKEVNSWFKRLPENKWRKNYSVDSRRISYFVNNHGLSEEECREMPKSLKKKSENASYKREQRYAEKYIEHLESKNLQESIVRQIIREMITEMTAKQHDWIAVDPTPKSLKKHFPKAQWIKKRQLVKLVEPINTQDEMKVIKVELPGNQKREVYVINIDFSSKKSHLGNR